MDAEVGDVPPGRGAAATDLGGHVEQRDEVELHPAPAAGLMEAKETGAVEILERLGRHLAPVLRASGPLAQHGHQPARPAHRLVVADVGEAGGRARRIGHARMPATCGIFE